MSTKRRIVQIMTLVAVLGTLGGGLAWAGIYVDAVNCPGPGDGSKGNPFCKIQDAVNLATTGDKIKIKDGIYHENVTIPGDKHFVNLDADPTATGAVTLECPAGGTGTGILWLTQLITGNPTDADGAHGIIAEDMKITNCVVGMEVYGKANLIEYNQLTGNGKGIVVGGTGNHIEDNYVAGSTYHGIELKSGVRHVLEDNWMANNGGWAIFVHRQSDADLIVENMAEYNGEGGYFIDGSSNDTLVLDNVAKKNYGDGFKVFRPSLLVARRIHFAYNKAKENMGDGFHWRGNIVESVLHENKAVGNDHHGFSLTRVQATNNFCKPNCPEVAPMENIFHHNVAQGNGLGNGSDGFHVEGLSNGAPEGNRFNQNDAEDNAGDGFDTDANSNGNVYIKNDANDNTGAGMRDVDSSGSGTAGTDNIYTDNDCADNVGGDSIPEDLCD